MNLGAQLGPLSITKLSPNWACQLGPIHFINFLLSGSLRMCARHVDSTNPGRSNLVFRSKTDTGSLDVESAYSCVHGRAVADVIVSRRSKKVGGGAAVGGQKHFFLRFPKRISFYPQNFMMTLFSHRKLQQNNYTQQWHLRRADKFNDQQKSAVAAPTKLSAFRLL